MKVIWEASDVVAGRRVRRPGCGEAWMIGYDPAYEGCNFAHISLIDGAISCQGISALAMAKYLNDSQEQPIEIVGEKDKK